MTHIAVIDVGKTNAKLALVDGSSLSEIAVMTRPNTVLTDGPWPHFDLDGHWAFFLSGLAEYHRTHGIDEISITTHGASITLIDGDGQAVPMLDYEHGGPDSLSAQYAALRPDFAQTGSPRLPMGLNVGAQLHWMFNTDPTLRDRLQAIVTYPQYWGYRLTGALATDVTSLGCHTDLWSPEAGDFSPLVDTLGIRDLIAPARKSSDVLGTISADIARATGLPAETPVRVGIHDSNASLYPHLLGRAGAFSVVSTGTWVIVMGMGGTVPALDPALDTLMNVNALGQPVPTARFMGGREYDLIRQGRTITPTQADRDAVLDGLCLLPAIEPTTGPFAGRTHSWTAKPQTEGQEIVALSYYLALMTDTCLTLIGAAGPTVIEGPFARNSDYLAMLACLRPDGIEIAASATGTSVGAALLCLPDARAPQTQVIAPTDQDRMRRYAKIWSEALLQKQPS